MLSDSCIHRADRALYWLQVAQAVVVVSADEVVETVVDVGEVLVVGAHPEAGVVASVEDVVALTVGVVRPLKWAMNVNSRTYAHV